MNTNPDRSLEVTTVFDGTVVAVAHLGTAPPRRGRIALAAGAALLVIAASIFGWSVTVARADARARAAHLERGEPAHSFRERRLPATAGFLAGAGLLGGLALIAAGLSRAREPRSRREFRVGRGAGVDFECESGGDGHALARLDDDGARLHLLPGMGLELVEGGVASKLDDVIARGLAAVGADGGCVVRLPDRAIARVVDGPRSFAVVPGAPPRRHPLGGVAGLDGRTALYLGGSAIVHLGLLALIWSLPADARSLSADDDLLGERMILVKQRAHELAVQEVPPPSDGKHAGTSGASIELGGGGGARGGGGEDEPLDGGGGEATSAEQARSRARTAGVLGVIAARPQLFASLGDSVDFASGFDRNEWVGGPGGRGGLDGPGGGGWGWDVEGVGGPGPLGTIKSGGFQVGGPWSTGGGDDLGPVRRGGGSRPPAPKIGDPEVSEGLDAAIIRRHVRRKLRRIRHCYERRLLERPDLAGTVTVAFTIGGDGTVLGAAARGTGDGELEGCVADVIATIAFPSTADRVVSNVKYPFTFRPAGQDTW